MDKLLIFVAGGIAGYIASGWLEGFTEKREGTCSTAVSETSSEEVEA
jgi:hypothetical protein